MGREWCEPHLIELIKKRIKIYKESGEGGSDDPDNPEVFSEYNYPIMLQNGINNGQLYLLKNNAVDGNWFGSVFFARPGAVASSFEKLPQHPEDFSFSDFHDNILPIGGETSLANNISKLSNLKTEIAGGYSTPSGTKGLVGYTSVTTYRNGSAYFFVAFPDIINDFDNDFNNLLQKLDSDYRSEIGGYYFLSNDRLANSYIDIYLILNTNKIVILRDKIRLNVNYLSVDFNGMTLYNAVKMYHVQGPSSISSFINSVKQFFTDNNLTFEYFKVMVTSIDFETSDVASATSFEVYEMN